MKKLFMILLLLFILFGCEETTFIELDMPENLRFTDAIYFDVVEHATSYVIKIDDEEIVVATNRYVLTEEGTYNVRVKARADGYVDSVYTNILVVEVDFTFSIPEDVIINPDHSLSWSSMNGATGYVVLVNGEQHNTSSTTFDLSTFYPGVLEVQVKAVYPLGSSLYSTLLVDEGGAEIVGTLKYNYSIYSNFDLDVLYSSSFVYIKDYRGTLDNTQYQYLSQTVQLDALFIQSLSLGYQTFTILTLQGFYIIDINIITTEKPYLINSSEVFTDFTKNLILTFELFDGFIGTLSGNDITTDDYTIDGNTIVIDIDYVEAKFIADEERTTLILVYTLEQGDDIVIGYLFIKES
ncbi:MAG TPA: hypothetical protein DEG42_03455 [Acholeplasmataceae bacterium]|nr:MAG: hypothetical protein A2013_02045 [Tenericutes bacterium GWE2_38_8]HBY65430.1 hypothetical protein [Acholeplasmataceae bacterium]